MYVCLMNMWGAVLRADRSFWGGYLRFGEGATANEKAYRFGNWLGNRYKNNPNVIWSLSGEYAAVNRYQEPITASQKALFNNVAQGLEDAHGGAQIMTIHSGEEFNPENWHDFTMLQSGHKPDNIAIGRLETYQIIKNAYDTVPPKPVVDGEMVYETYSGVTPAVVRRKTYWSVFAGGLGVTYGHVCIETMKNPYGTVESIILLCPDLNTSWITALNAEGGNQMQYLRLLMESLPDPLNRIPDQSVVLSGLGSGVTHVQATRDAGGKYVLVYVPDGHNVTVDMNTVSGASADVSWYNPQDGTYVPIGNFSNSGSQQFDPPGTPAEGNDRVLVLEKNGDSEKVIQLGDEWKYKEGIATPASTWAGISFDDASWLQGPTRIGKNGAAGIYSTELGGGTYYTFYARKQFDIADTSAVVGIKLHVGYDDGFVAYINGTEVARSDNVVGIPNHTTVTGTIHEVTDMGIFNLTENLSSLQNGSNVLAIEIHNKNNLSSGDIGIAPELEIISNILGYDPADVNSDGRVNIKDIQICIREIITPTGNMRADVNGDTHVNIKDIQEIIRKIINP